MLIRQEQLDALRADRLERFIIEVAARAAVRYPDHAEPHAHAREAVARSLAAGIDGERDVIAFVDLVFTLAPRFEEEWVRELLTQPLAGPMKIELLQIGFGVKEPG